MSEHASQGEADDVAGVEMVSGSTAAGTGTGGGPTVGPGEREVQGSNGNGVGDKDKTLNKPHMITHGGTPSVAGSHSNGINPNVPVCGNCGTQTTPLWRRSSETNTILCNACALFLKMKGRPRPISLKTDVIKQRNRTKGSSEKTKSSATGGGPSRPSAEHETELHSAKSTASSTGAGGGGGVKRRSESRSGRSNAGTSRSSTRDPSRRRPSQVMDGGGVNRDILREAGATDEEEEEDELDDDMMFDGASSDQMDVVEVDDREGGQKRMRKFDGPPSAPGTMGGNDSHVSPRLAALSAAVAAAHAEAFPASHPNPYSIPPPPPPSILPYAYPYQPQVTPDYHHQPPMQVAPPYLNNVDDHHEGNPWMRPSRGGRQHQQHAHPYPGRRAPSSTRSSSVAPSRGGRSTSVDIGGRGEPAGNDFQGSSEFAGQKHQPSPDSSVYHPQNSQQPLRPSPTPSSPSSISTSLSQPRRLATIDDSPYVSSGVDRGPLSPPHSSLRTSLGEEGDDDKGVDPRNRLPPLQLSVPPPASQLARSEQATSTVMYGRSPSVDTGGSILASRGLADRREVVQEEGDDASVHDSERGRQRQRITLPSLQSLMSIPSQSTTPVNESLRVQSQPPHHNLSPDVSASRAMEVDPVTGYAPDPPPSWLRARNSPSGTPFLPAVSPSASEFRFASDFRDESRGRSVTRKGRLRDVREDDSVEGVGASLGAMQVVDPASRSPSRSTPRTASAISRQHDQHMLATAQELGALRTRVAELEFINGIMEARLTELEKDRRRSSNSNGEIRSASSGGSSSSAERHNGRPSVRRPPSLLGRQSGSSASPSSRSPKAAHHAAKASGQGPTSASGPVPGPGVDSSAERDFTADLSAQGVDVHSMDPSTRRALFGLLQGRFGYCPGDFGGGGGATAP